MSSCCWPCKVTDDEVQSKSPIFRVLNNIKKTFYSPKIERNPIPNNYPKNCTNCNLVYYHSNLVDYCSGECKLSDKYYGCNSYDSSENYLGYNSD